MTPEFLDNISKNDKLKKMFTNPEYMLVIFYLSFILLLIFIGYSNDVNKSKRSNGKIWKKSWIYDDYIRIFETYGRLIAKCFPCSTNIIIATIISLNSIKINPGNRSRGIKVIRKVEKS